MSAVPHPPSAFPEPRLRRLDGAAELAAATATASAATRPEAVTALLSALLESIGGGPADAATVRSLPCGTREWLLQWTATRVGQQDGWFEVPCTHCGTPFDLSIDISRPLCAEPAHPASEVQVETSLGPRSFAVPTGIEEEHFARLDIPGDPRRAFAGLCALSADGATEAEIFDEHDLDLIEDALEAASPEVADRMQALCPACGTETTARLDPLRFAFPTEREVLERIHVIAGGYHWQMPDILSLSRRHLGWFADRIAQDRRAGRGAI